MREKSKPPTSDALARHPRPGARSVRTRGLVWDGGGGARLLTWWGPARFSVTAGRGRRLPRSRGREGRGAGLPQFSRLASWLGGPSGAGRRRRECIGRGHGVRCPGGGGVRGAAPEPLSPTRPGHFLCPPAGRAAASLRWFMPSAGRWRKPAGLGSCRARLRGRREARSQDSARGSPAGGPGAGSWRAGGPEPRSPRGRWDLCRPRPADPPPLWLLVCPLRGRRASLEKLSGAQRGGLGPDPTFTGKAERPPRRRSFPPQLERQGIRPQHRLCGSLALPSGLQAGQLRPSGIRTIGSRSQLFSWGRFAKC